MSAAATPPPAARVEEVPHEDSLTAASGALFASLRQQARDVAELGAAEARLAALSGLGMLACAVLAAAALLMTWVLLVVLAVDGLTRLGLPWQLAVAVLAAAHLLAAYGLWRGIVGLSGNLVFPRLRRTVLSAGLPPRGG